MKKVFVLVMSLLVFISCNKEDAPTPSTSAELITNPAEAISGTSATLGGTLISGDANIFSRGVCWGTSENPIINGFNFMQEEVGSLGTFSFQVIDLLPNTVYYVRAFVQSLEGGDITYANQVSFTTTLPITTTFASAIMTRKATLNGSIVQPNGSGSYVGFFLSTDANVSVNDVDYVANFNLIGSDTFSIELDDLEDDTVYYAKSYIYAEGNYTLGNAIEFRTTGYYGPANGYVGYDKGTYTDGWRYLEIYPDGISFNPIQHAGYYWGPYGITVANTRSDLGAGLENTQIIVNAIANADCAARGCYEFEVNGFSDWFLPSADEATMFNDSFRAIGINLYPGNGWTSTQYDSNNAYSINFNISQFTYQTIPTLKGNGLTVLPMRRY